MSLDTDVLIIGGGPSGLGMAIQLIRNFGSRNFTIVDKSDNIGGTWYANSYPGCGCDVKSHFYSFSFALNPNWSREFALQPEIDQYFSSLAQQYRLRQHMRLSTAVEQASWEEGSGSWLVTVRDQTSLKTSTLRCKMLVSAVGSLSVPKDCDIPGNSAKWDHSFDYADKDVVVIGNGCSATQFVPIMSDGPKAVRKITQFARQAHWLTERPNPVHSEAFKFTMRWLPGVMRLYRWYLFTLQESGFSSLQIERGQKLRDADTREQTAYIRANAPARYRDALVPTSIMGCKRKVMDTDYLACLHRPNVELVHANPIARISSDEVITASGRSIRADAIVLANGFKTHQPLFPMRIHGRNGVDLSAHWTALNGGSPEAYFGTLMSDFPNFFVLMGPNTMSGHLSVLYTTECQINYVVRLIRPILASLHPSPLSLRELLRLPPSPDVVAVKREAKERDVEWVARAVNTLVWSTGCSSWFIDERTGKNTMMYPDWQFKSWLRSLWPKWGDLSYSSSKEAREKAAGRSLWPRYTVFAVTAAVVAGVKSVGLWDQAIVACANTFKTVLP